MFNKLTRISGAVEGLREGIVYGWVKAEECRKVNLVIQLILGESVVNESSANIVRSDLGESVYGFSLKLPIDCFRLNKANISVVVKEANFELAGSPLVLDRIHRFSWAIDGYLDRKTLSGYLKDHVNPNSKFTIELLENKKPITSSTNDLIIDESGETGRFVLLLPEYLMDESLHDFTFRCAELKWDFETQTFLTPSNDPQGDYVPPPYIDDPEWEKSPAGISFKNGWLKNIEVEPDIEKSTNRFLLEIENKTSDKNDSNYQTTCDLAELYFINHQIDNAIKFFRKAITIRPFETRAYINLADTLLESGKEFEAENELRKALKKIPEDPEILTAIERLMALRNTKSDVKVIAFYLPQFHPTPENDKWWGKGFTEWANVTSATPMFNGHNQPRLPTDLGYYDLRLPESANAQFKLARSYGIDAFCYYYYWFNGKKLLDQPLQDLVEGKTDPFPFCICWANEDWTRSWDGMSGEVLLAQNHTKESDFQFIQDVAHLLKHQDYVRYDGKPVLLIYRADKLSNPKKTVTAWRKWCLHEGVGEIHLCAVQSFGFDDPRPLGFDAAVEFPPHSPWNKYKDLHYHVEIPRPSELANSFSGKLYSYQSFADAAIGRPSEPYKLHRACMLAWDNSARRGKSAHIFHWFSTKKYHEWLVANIDKASRDNLGGLTFINAWNEWAEGSALEPDSVFGHALLQTTKHAIDCGSFAFPMAFWKKGAPILSRVIPSSEERVLLIGHDGLRHGAQINLLNMARSFKRNLKTDVIILLLEGGDLVVEYEKVAKTIILGQEPGWTEVFKSIVLDYSLRGINKAICNTVVTGSVARILKENQYSIINLIHELPALIESNGYQNECYEIAKNTNNIVFASEIVANEFCERYPVNSDSVLIAPQGIVFNPYIERRNELRKEIRDKCGFDQTMRIMMGCGYGDTRKGIDLFIQVAGEVARTNSNVAFIWVGQIDLNLISYIQADITRLGLLDLFHITGQIDNANQYFVAADIYALTSREDPFPSVVMEAFDAGLPVVAFEGGGGYIDIVNNKTGALVPYLNVMEMAVAVTDLLKDSRRLKQMCLYNHEFCRNYFGYPQYLQKLMALFAGVPPNQVKNGVLFPKAWYGDAGPPKVSVIVPNYNYGRYLELRLRTILKQTLSPVEVIILDDGSSDYSLKLIKQISKNSQIPIRLIENTKNSGNVFSQWVKGLENITGDLVWIAEADDYCEPTFLETLIKEFNDPDVVLAWCDSIIVDGFGKSQGYEYKKYYGEKFGKYWNNSFKVNGSDLIENCLAITNVIPNASAALFRKKILPKNLKEIQAYKFSGDWWFWLTTSEKGLVSYNSEPLNYHRRHNLSVVGSALKEGSQLITETLDFYRRLAESKGGLLTTKTIDDIFDELEGMYRKFPKLQSESFWLRNHPDFSESYRLLAKKLALPISLAVFK